MGPIDYNFLMTCLGIAGVGSVILYYTPVMGVDLKEAWKLTIGVGAFVHFVFSFNPIPSGSMLNTLWIGDRVIVNNFIYGFGQYSFPFGLGPIRERILAFKKPKRGEIVVFRSKFDIHKPFVKRLVGMPGDKVQIIGGELYINNQLCAEIFIKDTTQKRMDGKVRPCKVYKRTLPGGFEYEFAKCEARGKGYLDNTGAYYLKDDEYFMMGDNMDGSDDSRGNLGVIKYRNIIGRVEMIGFSWDGTKNLAERLLYINFYRFFTFF